jgi:hypothetical protein
MSTLCHTIEYASRCISFPSIPVKPHTKMMRCIRKWYLNLEFIEFSFRRHKYTIIVIFPSVHVKNKSINELILSYAF